MNQLSIQLSSIYELPGNTTQGLWHFVDEYKRGEIVLPAHQRDFVWSDEKVAGWIDRIKSNILPVGVIVIYQIVEDRIIGAAPKFINDGSQRIRATEIYIDNPELFGDDKKTAEAYTRACHMTRQHRLYESSMQALIDFQGLNVGTTATPYEFCSGILTYMKNWDRYKGLLEEFASIMDTNAARIIRGQDPAKSPRKERHKHLRNNYGIVLRFLRKYEGLYIGYSVASSEPALTLMTNKEAVEWGLREELEETKLDKAESEIRKLISVVENETALIYTVFFDELGHNSGEGITATLFRWLIEASLWKRFNKIPHRIWKDFLRRLLDISGGDAFIQLSDEEGRMLERRTLGLGRLCIPAVCRIIKSPMMNYVGGENRLRIQRAPGFDDSHILPFSEYGDGKTKPEPGGDNRSRGAKPIQDDELENLDGENEE